MVRATWNGGVVAESEHTVILEGGHYFPPASVDRQLVCENATQSTCPWKGVASYFDMVVDDQTNDGAAWYYREPSPEAKEIRIMSRRGKVSPLSTMLLMPGAIDVPSTRIMGAGRTLRRDWYCQATMVRLFRARLRQRSLGRLRGAAASSAGVMLSGPPRCSWLYAAARLDDSLNGFLSERLVTRRAVILSWHVVTPLVSWWRNRHRNRSCYRGIHLVSLPVRV